MVLAKFSTKEVLHASVEKLKVEPALSCLPDDHLTIMMRLASSQIFIFLYRLLFKYIEIPTYIENIEIYGCLKKCI